MVDLDHLLEASDVKKDNFVVFGATVDHITAGLSGDLMKLVMSKLVGEQDQVLLAGKPYHFDACAINILLKSI